MNYPITLEESVKEVIPFLLWMAYSLCSPTELVTLHSYSFGANNATQHLQRRLRKRLRTNSPASEEDTFLCHWNNQAPNKNETQVSSHPVNEQFLSLHTDHLEQRQQDDTSQERAWGNTRQRVHGIAFWWLVLRCKTPAGIHRVW